MKDKIEAIVRQVVIDYYNSKVTLPISTRSDHLFILLDEHATSDFPSIEELLRTLSNQYDLTICTPKDFPLDQEIDCKHLHLIQENLDEIKQEMDRASLLILANSHYSNLAKLALSIDDTLGMWIILQMQLDGKKIVFAEDSLMRKGTQKVTAPHSVNDRIQTYIRQLRQEKVHFVSLAKMAKWLASYFENESTNNHVVLAKHIKEAADEGDQTLIVPKGSLITPMCKDYAKELGIRIKQKE